MSSVETPRDADSGFGLSSREATVIGGASALMAINVLLMYVFVETPLAVVNDYLFSIPIVGVIVYGIAIMGGERIAQRGVTGDNMVVAVAGVVVLQFAFGIFGAGVLAFAPRSIHLSLLVVTAVVVAVLTAVVSAYIYTRSKSFENWGRYANFSFIGGIVAVLIGTFFTPVLLVGFVFIFIGFLLYLGWEIWRMRDYRNTPVALQTIGVYIAVAGVFVHVLQIVLSMSVDE